VISTQCLLNQEPSDCISLSSICLPSGLQQLCPYALTAPNLREVCIEEGNCSFKVKGHFTVDFEGISMIQYFGELCEVIIWRSIIKLSYGCFAYCGTVSSVIFERGSKLSCIERFAFYNCSSLSSICIPSSVEKICDHCFFDRNSLSTITFESGSKLSGVEYYAFYICSSLSSICIPSSVEKICGTCFRGCNSLSTITFESDSKLSCIERDAFYNCSSLSTSYVPSS
jgi:hypothetical protein